MKKTIFIEKIFAIVIALTITLTLNSCEKEEQQPIEPEPDPRIEEFYELAVGEWELYSIYVENAYTIQNPNQPDDRYTGYVYIRGEYHLPDDYLPYLMDVSLTREEFNVGFVEIIAHDGEFTDTQKF